MPDINKEYADLYQKYGYQWADAFNKVKGMGWNVLPIKPRTMEEQVRVFVDYVKKGYAVHFENKFGDYYIYVLKQPEIAGHKRNLSFSSVESPLEKGIRR